MPWWSQITPVLAALSPIAGLFGVWLGQWISRRNTETQWLKDQKLKVYGDVLRAMNEYSLWLLDTSDDMKFGGGEERQNTLDKQNQQIAAEFQAAYAVAALFVSEESWTLIDRARPVFFSHSDPLADFDPNSMDAEHDKLTQIRGELISCAKSDLARK